jgi:hypothetical protein
VDDVPFAELDSRNVAEHRSASESEDLARAPRELLPEMLVGQLFALSAAFLEQRDVELSLADLDGKPDGCAAIRWDRSGPMAARSRRTRAAYCGRRIGRRPAVPESLVKHIDRNRRVRTWEKQRERGRSNQGNPERPGPLSRRSAVETSRE